MQPFRGILHRKRTGVLRLGARKVRRPRRRTCSFLTASAILLPGGGRRPFLQPWFSGSYDSTPEKPCQRAFARSWAGCFICLREKTYPPTRSNGEWGAYSLIGLSIGPYLEMFKVPFMGNGENAVPELLPIHKTFMGRGT